MREYSLQTLIHLAFLSQVLLLSYVLPRQILGRMRHVVQTYPPREYPRLYPVGTDEMERTQRTFAWLNGGALAIGLAMVGTDLLRAGPGPIDWDNELVLVAYMLLQFAPLLVISSSRIRSDRPAADRRIPHGPHISAAVFGRGRPVPGGRRRNRELLVMRSTGFTYFNLERPADTRSTRVATLRPRRLLDYAPPLLLALAVLTYGGFVWLVLFVGRLGYPWFGGLWNIVGISMMNLGLAALVAFALRARRVDPYQSERDRERGIATAIGAAIWQASWPRSSSRS